MENTIERRRNIVDYLIKNGPKTVLEIEIDLGMPKGYTNSDIPKLRIGGYIRKSGRVKVGKIDKVQWEAVRPFPLTGRSR